MGAIGNLIPLVLLLFFVGCFAWVGWQMYIFANDLGARGKKHMERNNMTFTQDGLKVGVKEVRPEDYEDKTQSVLVNMWNHTSFPAYKSRLWNTAPTAGSQSGSASPSAGQRSGSPAQKPSTPRSLSSSSGNIRQRAT